MRLTLHKIQCILQRLNPDRRHIIRKSDTIDLLRNPQHLRSERRADELSSNTLTFLSCIATTFTAIFRGLVVGFGGAISFRREVPQVIGYCCSVLRIKVRVYLVEDVEGCWVSLLDCED